MPAVAFTQTLIFRGARDNRVIHMPMTVSDVAAGFALTPSGGNAIQLNNDQNYMLIDAIVVVGGTDTNFQNFFVNGLQSPLKISNKSNLNTSNFRQFQQAPVTFAAGAQLQLQQSVA